MFRVLRADDVDVSLPSDTLHITISRPLIPEVRPVVENPVVRVFSKQTEIRMYFFVRKCKPAVLNSCKDQDTFRTAQPLSPEI